MEGTNFSNGVLVTQVDLERSQSTKETEIRRNRVELASRGILSGGEITVNATNTDRIDIAAFAGFTPRGDHVSATVSNNNYPLGDYTVGVENYVLAIYTETLTGSKPHESDGNTYPTRKESSYRIVIMSEADYLDPSVLTPSDDNLSVDAKDRALVLGIVTANGTSTALTASSIQSPVAFNDLLYTNPVEITSMAGVSINYVDPTTTTGTGLLEYQYSSPNYQLRWTSPGGTVGAWQSWTVDDELTVTDAIGKYIRVYMVVSQMATTGTFPFTQSIEVIDLYHQDIPRNTGEDWLHRKMRGTGIVSERNPHGQTVNDLSGESIDLLDEHQDIMHCNGIWKGSSSTTLSSYVIPSSPNDSLGINTLTSNDLYYINGIKLTEVNNTSFSFSPAFAGVVSSLWECYVDDDANAAVYKKFEYPASRNVRGTWIIDSSDNYAAGTYTLKLRIVTSSPADKFYFSWDNGVEELIYDGDSDRALRLFSEDGLNWIDLWVRSSTTGATDAYIPASNGTYTDSIVAYSSVSLLDNMPIAKIPYWYDSITIQTFIGYAPYDVSRSIVDKRIWGTICADNMNDSFLQDYIYHANNELGLSGVLKFRDVYNNSIHNFELSYSGLDVTVSGGHAYCRGKRLNVDAETITLVANKNYILYVGEDGLISELNVTDDFAGDRVSALEYLQGNNAYRKNVSSSYHATTDAIGNPERGIPLYYVDNGASAVDYFIDISRNVNGVTDPWSVGIEKGLAFATLEGAFLHASLSGVEGVTITVDGIVMPYEILEQPSNVTVAGTPSGYVTTASISSSPSTGVWLLGSGCAVKNLEILSFNSDYLFGLNENVVIEGCNIYNIYSFTYLFGDNSASSVENVNIINNKLTIVSLLSASAFPSPELKNWLISGNTIVSPTIGFFSSEEGLIHGAFRESVITNNMLYPRSYSSGYLSAAISLDDADRTNVSNNVIVIGAGTGSVIEAGVIVNGCSTVSVTGNVFRKDDSNTNNSSVGVYLSAAAASFNTVISGNSFKSINVGVYGASGFTAYNTNIVGNNFMDLKASAVSLTPTLIKNLSITSNEIRSIIYSASSLSGIDNPYGIYVHFLAGSSSYGLDISNNVITNMQLSSSATRLTGIDIEADSGTYSLSGIKVTANTIGDLRYTGSTLSNSCIGVYCYLLSSEAYSVSLSDNTIFDLTSASGVSGIYYYGLHSTSSDTAVINGNTFSDILIEDTQSISKKSSIIYAVGHSSSISPKVEIIGNKIDAVTEYAYNSSTNYIPAGIYVYGNFDYYKVDQNNIRYRITSGDFWDYSGMGIYINTITNTNSIGSVNGNEVYVPRSAGIYPYNTGKVSIKNNEVSSQSNGIEVPISTTSCDIINNKVCMLVQPDEPSPGLNNVFNGDACILVNSSSGFTVQGNRTYTNDEVHRISDNLPSTSYKAYHMLCHINDDGLESNMYKIEGNRIDLRSQGNNSNNFSLTGIYFVEGSSYDSSKNHLVSVLNNSLDGGATFTSAVTDLPYVYSASYEPTMIRFGALTKDSGVTAHYFVAGNTSCPGNLSSGVGYIAHINADATTDVINFDTNMDQGLYLLNPPNKGLW